MGDIMFLLKLNFKMTTLFFHNSECFSNFSDKIDIYSDDVGWWRYYVFVET